jgi:hypothetical protein
MTRLRYTIVFEQELCASNWSEGYGNFPPPKTPEEMAMIEQAAINDGTLDPSEAMGWGVEDSFTCVVSVVPEKDK